MKIGRNEPCYCGSGKKYKKCCLLKENSNLNSTFIDGIQSHYNYIRPISKKIYNRIKKYKFDDIVVASFCLNLWRRNRSAIAQALSLNMALVENLEYGNIQIKSYDEFVAFYNDFSDIMTITHYEDYTIDDFGEVFINHNGKSYPIIIGTGYQQVYAMYRYLQTLVSISGKDNELIDILEYMKTIIESTVKSNKKNDDYSINYELPNSDFWELVKKMFGDILFKKQYEKVALVMGYQHGPIEMRHFVKNGDKIYPLCNLSILVDYYTMLLQLAGDDKINKHVTLTIASLLDSSFNYSPNTPTRVLINPYVIDKETQNKLIDDKLIFAILRKKCVLVGITGNEFLEREKMDNVVNILGEANSTKGLCLVESFPREDSKGLYGVTVEPNTEILYIFVDPFTNNASEAFWVEEDNSNGFNCTALDIVYLMGFSDNFDEIEKFIRFDKIDKKYIFSFGGKSNLFLKWKSSYQNIALGAIEYDHILIDFNETEQFTYDYFKDNMKEFPRNSELLFSDPLNWTVEKDEPNKIRLLRKGCYGFGGNVKKLGSNMYVLFFHNIEMFSELDMKENYVMILNVIDEFNYRLFSRYSDLISKFTILKGKTLQLLFIPWNYALQHENYTFVNDVDRTIVYSDEYIDTDSCIIRFTVNPENILDEIQDATDRTIENCYFKELLEPISKYAPESYKNLVAILNADSTLPKTVGVFSMDQYYYFSNEAIDTEITGVGLVKAKNEIAKACLEAGVKPGEYKGKEATKVIRNIQLTAVRYFENLIASFDESDLHNKALNYLSIQQHGIIVNAQRYGSFENLDKDILQEFEESTRKIREEYRRHAETAKYLIESNLFVKHDENTICCTKDDFVFLLSFADWLVTLQDDADVCYYQENEYTIVVSSNYIVDPEPSEELQSKCDRMILRKYNSEDYSIKKDEIDIQYMQRVADAFQEDKGVNFSILLSLMEFMQLNLIENFDVDEIYSNVFSIDKSNLEKAFLSVLVNQDIVKEEIVKAIDFMVVDVNNLKSIGSTKHDILPIWEREKRENRFDVKPIVVKNEKCIFSPVIISSICEKWKSGMCAWFLPYELGFTKVQNVLREWKKRYEDEMVKDIARILRESQFDLVILELEFCKRFPKESYPKELGDYDVFAVNKSRKEIWLIESKVLQKVASIYEIQMQQKSFFLNHKEDEKFQRRISYVENNQAKIIKSLNLDEQHYTIIPYMVTNKVFESMYKQLNFPIVSIHEFKTIIENL